MLMMFGSFTPQETVFSGVWGRYGGGEERRGDGGAGGRLSDTQDSTATPLKLTNLTNPS